MNSFGYIILTIVIMIVILNFLPPILTFLIAKFTRFIKNLIRK